MPRRLRPLNEPRTAAGLAVFTARLREMRSSGFASPEQAAGFRAQARAAKTEYLARPHYWLEMLAKRLEERGGQVHFAADAAQARAITLDICRRAGARSVVKGKSMVAEEMELNPALEGAGMEVSETDLGEFIIQLAGERPFHILGPAMHKDRGQVAQLFRDKLGVKVSDEPSELTKAARAVLRRRFLRAQVGITGVNAAACQSGTLALISNEGNGRYCSSLPAVHIALMTLEKAVPNLADLALLSTLIPRAATGALPPSYVSWLSGPSAAAGAGGPRQMHLVILDNGRSHILETEFWEMLLCLRCSSCLNFCPVYGLAGGHAWGGTYPGPMGGVLDNLLPGQVEDRREALDLAQACSQCGRCQEMCPMGIDLPGMLLKLRQRRSVGLGELPAELGRLALSRPPLFAAARALAGPGLAALAALPPGLTPPGPWKAWREGGRRLPRPPRPGGDGHGQG